jgi:hypothetical protein
MLVSTERKWIMLINFDSELTFEEITITDEMMNEVRGEIKDYEENEDKEDYNPTDEDVIADILVNKMQALEQGWGKVFPIPISELTKLNKFFN